MDQAVETRTEYVDFWNEILVPKFVRWKHIIVDGLTHHSAAVFPRLAARPGDRVVDVGCGFGDTAILLAVRVGPAGSVLGMDCCDAFLAFGRRDAAAAGVGNVAFVEADVQQHPFHGEFDFCFSRFGTQFFENPVAALRNMRSSLRPGGTMTMIVWRGLDENPWLAVPKQVVMRFLPPPGEDARTCGPGPFSMADPDVVRTQLRIAGYDGVGFERIDAPLLVGRTPEEAVELQFDLGPAGEIFREAGAEAERQRGPMTAALTDALGA
ncbi:MAG TPA: methyltransferase domain-containing protein, partial [Amaricoccus sp.]|nr:methyltransferase domain-containing protein [Amaricoccus sp.]